MERSLKEDEMIFSFPTEEEMTAAQNICCGKCCLSCETPAAYAWRKRDADLSVLLERAVETELSDTERIIIEEYFYNSKKLVTIAAERGVSSSAAGKTLERAIGKLRDVLKYVIMYQRGIDNESVVPLALSRAAAILRSSRYIGESSGERLLSLRMKEGLSRKSVSEITGISAGRLGYIERDEQDICGEELVKLCDFYNVSTDYIMKGI